MSTRENQFFDREKVGDVLVITFTIPKILDEWDIQRIGEMLFMLTDEQGEHQILIDFKNVTYISSLMLNKFITLNKKIGKSHGKLVLCGIFPAIYEVFEITKLNKFFCISRDREIALQEFTAKEPA